MHHAAYIMKILYIYSILFWYKYCRTNNRHKVLSTQQTLEIW